MLRIEDHKQDNDTSRQNHSCALQENSGTPSQTRSALLKSSSTAVFLHIYQSSPSYSRSSSPDDFSRSESPDDRPLNTFSHTSQSSNENAFNKTQSALNAALIKTNLLSKSSGEWRNLSLGSDQSTLTNTSTDDKLDTTYKNEVIKCLNQYISIWKISLFGHHHNKRAKVVKEAISRCNSNKNIQEILSRQDNIMNPTCNDNIPSVMLPDRWFKRSELRTKPKKPEESGYYNAIQSALKISIST